MRTVEVEVGEDRQGLPPLQSTVPPLRLLAVAAAEVVAALLRHTHGLNPERSSRWTGLGDR